MADIPNRGKVALYAAIGPEVTHYEVDVEQCTLVQKQKVRVPKVVQYACADGAANYLYVISSDGGRLAEGTAHHLAAFRIDRANGALVPHGAPVPLTARPVHMTLDVPAKHALIAYHHPPRATVHRITGDGSIGEEVTQGALDNGIYPHQIRVMPSNRLAIVSARGNYSGRSRPEEPGSLKIFSYRDGALTNHATIAPNNGYGFGPRNVDFHPSKDWMFLVLERQSRLLVYQWRGDTVQPVLLFDLDTMINPALASAPRQMAGEVYVHPNGKFVYMVNRYDRMTEFQDKKVVVGGENNIAVFSINQETGEPSLIQHIAVHGIHARTFAIDPSGRMLVTGNFDTFHVRESDRITTLPAGMSVYRIGEDGKLEFARNYDLDTGREKLFWVGMVPLN